MTRLRCEVLSREGDAPLPCLVRTEDGRLLRLVADGSAEASWLGTWQGVPVFGERRVEAPDGDRTGETLEIDTPALDEVEVHAGPDQDGGGLFDAPGTTDGTVTGERTGSEAGGARPEQRRTAVLAWIAADAEPPGDDAPGAPCEPLKRLIADEPPDPLPAIDGGPHPAPPPAPPAPRALAAEWPEPEETATQIEGPPASPPVTPRPTPPPAPSALRPWVLAVVLVLLLALWTLVR